jgi:hypothetical protein
LGQALDRDVTINLDALDIPHHDLLGLEVPFAEEEVWRTVCSLPSDKAPGPYDFTRNFYKACWPIIKTDMMAAISSVWSRKFGNFSLLNWAYIILLPKKR